MTGSFSRLDLHEMAKRKRVLPFERGNRPRDHLYASHLGSCPRAVWFGWKYPELRPEDEFPETRGALGHWIEDGVAGQLNGMLVAREVSFYDEEHHISGRVDFIVRLTHAGPMIPVELKTTAAYDRFLAEPLENHLLQLRYYLTQMPDAPFGILIYYSLSAFHRRGEEESTMGQWTALVIPRDDEAVRERAARLWRIVRHDQPPECEHRDDKGGCWDCSKSAEVVWKQKP